MLKRLSSSLTPSGLEGSDRFAARWGLAYLVLLVASSTVLIRVLAGSGDVDAWRRIVSLLSLGTLVFFLVTANRYLQQDATDESERRHLRAIKPQLINAKPRRLTIHVSESLGSYRYEVQKLFDGRTPDQTTIRDSLGEFRRAWRDQTRVLPGLAVKLSYEAALILVFGAIVVLPVTWWSGGESLAGSIPPIGALLWALLTGFPGAELLISLAALAVLEAGGVLFDHWFVISLILFVGAGLIGWLDRETAEDLDVTLYPDRRHTIGAGVAIGALIYAAGAIAATVFGALFELVGLSIVGDLIGLAVAAYLAAVIGRDVLADLGARLVSRQDRPDDNTGLVAAYLVVRKVWATIGVLCLPLLVGYVVLAFGTGALFAVALEVATAPWHIRLPALAIVLLAALLVKANYPDLTDELLEAGRRATSSSVVRGFVFARGVPFVAVFVGFALTWALQLGVEAALIAGLIAGVFARLVTLSWQVAAYRFIDFADSESGVSEVVIEAFEIEDADGEPIYIARVDGHELAHRDRDALIDIAISVAEHRFETGETPATFAHYYYEEATEHGHVDIQFVADEFMGDIKTRIQATLRENGGELEVETMDKELTEEYSESAYRTALHWLRNHGDVDVRRGKYVLH